MIKVLELLGSPSEEEMNANLTPLQSQYIRFLGMSKEQGFKNTIHERFKKTSEPMLYLLE